MSHSPTAQILIVDDTPENIDVLSDILASLPCRIKVATSGEKALELVQRQPPALVLLDVMMPPGIDGFETCRRLKADTRTAQVPLIFVTARQDDVGQGFAVGAVDYITKPIQADEVRARVNHQLERHAMLQQLQQLNRELEDKVRERTAELTLTNHQLRQEVNERRYMQDRLNYLATHDFVTRLHNRHALDAQVCEQLARLQLDRDAQATFLQIDIDQFRLVNESCGCIAGDELLRHFADTVAALLDRQDFFARLGGDRFGILIQTTRAGDGMQQAQRIQRQLRHFEFQWEARVFRFAATIAVVPLDTSIISFEQLMVMADETTYLAKHEGRGVVRRYQNNTDGPAHDHRETINWTFVLMDALKHHRLQVHFQRLQPLGTTTPAGLRIETLMRLWDPARAQLVLPGSFIPAAERFQLIIDLDRWMLGEVIELLGREQPLHDQIDQVTVNLSAVTLRDPGLADLILGLLDRHGVPGRLLCLEITETEAILNLPLAQELMRRLHKRGCHFALDDFGSGFASYRYLRELDFDMLKIDGVFVRDMDLDPTNAAMVRSMMDMARLLGKPVVAECVETSTVSTRLNELGVNWAQGYLYHRPEPLSSAALQVQIAQLRADRISSAALH